VTIPPDAGALGRVDGDWFGGLFLVRETPLESATERQFRSGSGDTIAQVERGLFFWQRELRGGIGKMMGGMGVTGLV
jgi:hypothetical protein